MRTAGETPGAPPCRRFTRRLQNPPARLQRRRTLNQRVDESRRREQPALRVLPAQERLGAHHRSVAHSYLRLVVQDEFLVGAGAAQFAVDLLARPRLRPHRRDKERTSVTSGGLRLVKSQVRVSDQFVGVKTFGGRDGDAGAGSHKKGAAADFDLLFDLLQQRDNGRPDHQRIGAIAKDQEEFVAAKPVDLTRRHRAHAPCDFLEQPISGRVPRMCR